jgi:hypothetical protein
MALPVSTPSLFRVQAKGGKFLGDDIGGAELTIRNARTGQWLAGGRVQGDSGTLSASYAPTASPSVLVAPPSTLYWLVPDLTTSKLYLDLPLTAPTLLEIEAFGPLGGLQSAQKVVTNLWALPRPLPLPPVIVELPGLVVQVLAPATHQEYPKVPQDVTFSINVTMMCGCPIGGNPYWLPSDFLVSATVTLLESRVPPVFVPLSWQGSPSLFGGTYKIQTPGYYQADITAVQQSTGNVGTATVTFFIKP